jgi:hypothetical protein
LISTLFFGFGVAKSVEFRQVGSKDPTSRARNEEKAGMHAICTGGTKSCPMVRRLGKKKYLNQG